jgi:exodeoxyribonuclease VII large subunit
VEVLSASQVTRYLRDLVTLDPVLHDVWVRGEVSNTTRSARGHVYWTLKDGTAQLPCAMFRQQAVFQPVQPQNGLQLLAHGRVDVYEAGGKCELIVDAIEAQGAGALYMAFEALKRKLEAEGLFDPARKRPLPARPLCIGLITSPTGAVLHDIVSVLSRRWPRAELLVAPAQVQGSAAAATIVKAFDRLEQIERVEVIVLARGGGSIEDLWPFNEEVVARRIAAATRPVISAVGHETDVTVADFVADVRAPTPSVAAEIVAPAIQDDIDALQALYAHIVDAALADVASRRQALQALEHRLALRTPVADVQRARQQLDVLERALAAQAALRLAGWRQHVASGQRQLALVDPRGVLQRGYAMVRRPAGGPVVTDAASVTAGDPLEVTLASGSLGVRVERVEAAGG